MRGLRLHICCLLTISFFCEASHSQMVYLSWPLMWFKAISSLKINLEKNELITIGEIVNVEDLVVELGYRVGNLPFTYLALLLGVPFKIKLVWDRVEERFKLKLSMWKRQYILKRRRLNLICNTLSSIPNYFMSLFNIPSKIRMRLEKIQKDFF